MQKLFIIFLFFEYFPIIHTTLILLNLINIFNMFKVSFLGSEFPKKKNYLTTRARVGATFGANCTIVCGVTIDQYAFVGAGAVVTRDVPAFALMVGSPAKRIGWMCKCGERLEDKPFQK